jgi:tight adherence protein C
MMIAIAAAFGLFLSIAIGISLFGYRRYVRPAQVHARLGQPVVIGNAISSPPKSGSARVLELLKKLGEFIPSGKPDEETGHLLILAGYRTEYAPQVFVGIRAAAVTLLFLGALLLPLGATPNPALRWILLTGAAGMGWRVPGIVLKKKVAARQERLRLSLPDAMDLIIISVEAGLGIDQAIQYVAVELRGGENEDLSEELQLIGMEMRAGLRRIDAFKTFAERTGEEEIQKLVAILIQNDRFGNSLGETLRNHSQDMRIRRKQQADERAAKVGVKLVFPIFFFILPSMMIVAAGPGLLQIFKYLFPMMKQIH